MSTVIRYDCISGVEGQPEMDPFGLGDWVAFDDYVKLEEELAALREAAMDYLRDGGLAYREALRRAALQEKGE